jgi:hypothetical protein
MMGERGGEVEEGSEGGVAVGGEMEGRPKKAGIKRLLSLRRGG